MSGFEIIGVVLGAFPILVGAAKSASGVYRDVETWWKFDKEFHDFVMDVQREFIAFSQIVDIVVDSFQEMSDEEKATLQNCPGTKLWLDERVQMGLKRRIPTDTQRRWFLSELGRLSKALEELCAMLPISKNQTTSSNELDSQLYKIRMSFSHQKDACLDTIKKGNETLYNFLIKVDHVTQMTTPASLSSRVYGKSMSFFLDRQRQARSLYDCFQSHWAESCSCNKDHQCSITVHEREFRVLCGDHPDGTALVRIQVTETGIFSHESTTPTTTANITIDVEELEKDLSNRAQGKKVKKENRQRIKRLVSRFNPRHWPGSVSRVSKQPIITQKPGALDENASQGQPQKTPPSVKHVSFAPTEEETQGAEFVTRKTAQEVLTTVANFCSIIEKRVNSRPDQNSVAKFLGYMEACPGTRLLLHVDRSDELPDLQPLDHFLQSTERRYDRLRIGHEMILLLLSLGPDWIPDKWSKNTVVVLHSPGDRHGYPYLSHGPIRQMLKSRSRVVDRRKRAEACLRSLGVLLLELLFGEPLELRSSQLAILKPDGQSGNLADELAILMWQKEVEKHFGFGIAEAIKRCLWCVFEQDADLGNSAFVRAIWENVALPVGRFADAFK